MLNTIVAENTAEDRVYNLVGYTAPGTVIDTQFPVLHSDPSAPYLEKVISGVSTPQVAAYDVSGTPTSAGHNFIGIGNGAFTAAGDFEGTAGSPLDPQFTVALRDTIDPSIVLAYAGGAPTTDLGSDSVLSSTNVTDQIGQSRQLLNHVDIGAVEQTGGLQFDVGPAEESLENSPPQTIVNWIANIANGVFHQVSDQQSFQITGDDNPALFSVAPSVSANGTLTYTLAPGVTGVANLTIVGIDGSFTSAPQYFSISSDIDSTIEVTDEAGPAYQPGDSVTFDINLSDQQTTGDIAPNTPVTVSFNVPAGFTVTSVSGGGWTAGAYTANSTSITATFQSASAFGPGLGFPTLRVTGTLSDSAAVRTTLTATDSLPGDLQLDTASDTVLIGTAPTFTSSATATFTAGYPGTFTVAATGSPAATFNLTPGEVLPSGVTLAPNSGVISGKPAASTVGNYTLHITAQNAIGSVTQTFVLSIVAPQMPVITSPNHVEFGAVSIIVGDGPADSFQVTATGIPTPTFGEIGTLPAGFSFDSQTGILSGTPSGAAGVFPLTFTADNGSGTIAKQAFTLTLDSFPYLTSAGQATFVAGYPADFKVTGVGIPTPSLNETGTLPAGITFIDHGHGVADLGGTPAAGSGGVYNLSLAATNSQGGFPVPFTLTIDQVPAITSLSNTTMMAGTNGSFTVNTTGFPLDAITEVGALPAGVTFVDNHDGTATISGMPTVTGTYLMTISAKNGIGLKATQNFTLNIDQPSAITSGNNTTFAAGVTNDFRVLTTGFPIAAVSETGALPSGVSFADIHNGVAQLYGVPAAGTGGVYPITITATNGAGVGSTQTFTLTVVQQPSITSLATGTLYTGFKNSLTVSTAGFPNAKISEVGGLPAGVTFTDNNDGTATLGGTPTGVSVGTYPLTITAINGVGVKATQSFTLSVAKPTAVTNLTPSQNPSTFGQADTVTLTLGPVIAGAPLPTGNVQFTNAYGAGTQAISNVTYFTAGGNYMASVSLNPLLGPGSHVITATYSGDNIYSGTSSQLTQVVSQATPAVMLTSSPPVRLTVTR